LSGAQREVKQAIERGETNIKWMEDNYEGISGWLAAKAAESASSRRKREL